MSASLAKHHIRPWDHSRQELLDAIGYDSLDALVDKVVPDKIQREEGPELPEARLRRHKLWSVVGRVDNVHGDRNLVRCCATVEAYA